MDDELFGVLMWVCKDKLIAINTADRLQNHILCTVALIKEVNYK